MEFHLPQKKQSEIKKQELTIIQIKDKWEQKYNEMEVKTFSDCFPSEDNKTLSQLVKMTFKIGNNEIKYSIPTKHLLFNAIKKFATSFNLTNNFTNEQIEEFTNDIFEFYPHLTVRDIKFFLKQVRAGNFGTNYNRMDGPLLFGYLKVYSDLRIGEAERHENNLTKVNTDKNYNPDLVFKHIAPIFKQTQAEISKPREKTEKELLKEKIYLAVHKEFMKLHRSQNEYDEPGQQFVKHNGKMMDFQEYYSCRFLEIEIE